MSNYKYLYVKSGRNTIEITRVGTKRYYLVFTFTFCYDTTNQCKQKGLHLGANVFLSENPLNLERKVELYYGIDETYEIYEKQDNFNYLIDKKILDFSFKSSRSTGTYDEESKYFLEWLEKGQPDGLLKLLRSRAYIRLFLKVIDVDLNKLKQNNIPNITDKEGNLIQVLPKTMSIPSATKFLPMSMTYSMGSEVQKKVKIWSNETDYYILYEVDEYEPNCLVFVSDNKEIVLGECFADLDITIWTQLLQNNLFYFTQGKVYKAFLDHCLQHYFGTATVLISKDWQRPSYIRVDNDSTISYIALVDKLREKIEKRVNLLHVMIT